MISPKERIFPDKLVVETLDFFPRDMESLVLCPEELCLGPAAQLPVSPAAAAAAAAAAAGGGSLTPAAAAAALLGVSPPPCGSADLSIWTADEAVEKGTRFLPWKGTVRSDKLPVFEKLPEFDVSYGIKFPLKFPYLHLLSYLYILPGPPPLRPLRRGF